jgi:hypothetical protein
MLTLSSTVLSFMLACRRMSGGSSGWMIAASSGHRHVLKSGYRRCDYPPEYGPATIIGANLIKHLQVHVRRMHRPDV